MRSHWVQFLNRVALVATLAAPAVTAQEVTVAGGLLIDSHPPLYARVGEQYVYQMHAVAAGSGEVVWYAGDHDNPPGLTLDSASGLVQWTPTMRGWFEITLHAFGSVSGHAEQAFHLAVMSGNGVIQGRVSDTAGVGIRRVIVELFQATPPPMMRPGASLFTFAVKTDSTGAYRMRGIDPGVYKLRAVSFSDEYASQWYDGKSNPSDANSIIIADTPSVTIANFTLRAGPVSGASFSVSGTVTDTASAPIAHAAVFFVSAGFVLNRSSVDEDFRTEFDMSEMDDDVRLDGASRHVFRRTTDSLGRYTISLPEGEYIAFARATGYETEFFLNASDFLTANHIDLHADAANIDFSLATKPPVVYGSIEGSVQDSSGGHGVRSRIIAWSDRFTISASGDARRAYVSDTDSSGAFTVAGLPAGSYIVLAVPLGSYAPSFYTTDSLSMRWQRATRVDVNGTAVTGIAIYVRPMPGEFRGFASIYGSVQSSGSPDGMKAGTIVSARVGARVAGVGVTDEAGLYTIAGLAPGSYEVDADRLGYTATGTKSVSVSYTSTGTPVNGTADLQIMSTTAVHEGPSATPATMRLAQNYPNPFNPSTMIQYSVITGGRVNLQVYNILGQSVRSLVNAVQGPGTYRVMFNATGLPSGVYFSRLEIGGEVQTRRMILLQ